MREAQGYYQSLGQRLKELDEMRSKAATHDGASRDAIREEQQWTQACLKRVFALIDIN